MKRTKRAAAGALGKIRSSQTTCSTSCCAYLQEHNPILRHTVLRRRQTLEDAGLLERIGVDVHPNPETPAGAYSGVEFSGLGLLTNLPFDLAYQAAEAFTEALQKRTKAAGFMKTMLLQRICSSFASGRSTADKMLRREMLEDEEQARQIADAKLEHIR